MVGVDELTMLDFCLILLMLALAIAAASITLTRARILKPVRDWAQPRNYLLFKVISCPYCLSHWFAAFLATYVRYNVTDNALLDWALAWFTLVGLSALLEGLMMNLLHMQENYIQELEDEVVAATAANEPPADLSTRRNPA